MAQFYDSAQTYDVVRFYILDKITFRPDNLHQSIRERRSMTMKSAATVALCQHKTVTPEAHADDGQKWVVRGPSREPHQPC